MRKGRRKRGDFAVASADAFEEPDKEMLTGFFRHGLHGIHG